VHSKTMKPIVMPEVPGGQFSCARPSAEGCPAGRRSSRLLPFVLLVILSFLFSAASEFSSSALAGEMTAMLGKTTGAVARKTRESAEWKDIGQNLSPLMYGDELRTGEPGFCQLDFPSGASLEIRGNSHLVFETGAPLLTLGAGRMQYLPPPDQQKAVVELSSPALSASTSEGDFLLSVTEKGVSTVEALEGTVEVSVGDEGCTMLHKGERISASPPEERK
jgi:hypothetical protein